MLAFIKFLMSLILGKDNVPMPPAPPQLPTLETLPGIILNSGAPGVQYNPPPAEIYGEVISSLKKASESLGEDDLAIIAVADRQGGWNGAVVGKLPGDIHVHAWIGKKWGTDSELDWGAQVVKTFKFNKK